MDNQIRSLFIENPTEMLSVLALTVAALTNMYIVVILLTNRSGSFDGNPIVFIIATTFCVLAVILGIFRLSKNL
jgi:hypothetical protein